MPPSHTVIVATFNSASNAPLRECLASIRRQQTTAPVRLIVVDGGSTDSTLDLARSSNAEVVNNPSISELGFWGGKNLALERVDSEFVTMVDADNVLIENDYLDQMTRPLVADSRIDVAVPCPYVPPRGMSPSITRYFCLQERDYWISLSNGGRVRENWIEFQPEVATIPNAGVMRRSALKNIGGWDYDTEVAARLIAAGRGTFAFVPNAHRFHVEMTSYREVWRKLNRRITNQMEHSEDKLTVGSEIRSALRNPAEFVRSELINPMTRFVQRSDTTYLQSVPVFGTKVMLGLARGVWKGTEATS